MLMSMICAPFFHLLARHGQGLFVLAIEDHAGKRRTVTLVRSPMLTNSVPAPMLTGSRPTASWERQLDVWTKGWICFFDFDMDSPGGLKGRR
jgi:hypothetical protein